MPATLDDLLPQALALPDDSKLLMAEELVASVSNSYPDVDALVDQRRAEFLAGAVELIPAEEAVRQVRAALAAHSRV